MTESVKILDCTLRDGSYEINFQFTAEDTAIIGSSLASCGVEYIEVGHGVGLGASEAGYGVAAETDLSYMKAASENFGSSDWGMFCIPGIASLEHLDMAADCGMKFVRIGANVEEYQSMEMFIDRAKKHGMFVCSNFMKSYTVGHDKFASIAANVAEFGSDVIYLVDSAGGMLAEDVAAYITEIKNKNTAVRVGFHGHNNLGMAVSNSIVAYEAGAEFLDVSLQGLGRSAGNAAFEQLLCVLLRKGVKLGIDPIKLFDIAEKYIYPLVKNKGVDGIDTISGLALFHSSYLPVIEKYSTKYRVDPRSLIMKVCEQDQVNAPEELVERLADDLAKKNIQGFWHPQYKHYTINEQGS